MLECMWRRSSTVMPSYDDPKRLWRWLSILRRRGTFWRSSSWRRDYGWRSAWWLVAVRGEGLGRWSRWWRRLRTWKWNKIGTWRRRTCLSESSRTRKGNCLGRGRRDGGRWRYGWQIYLDGAFDTTTKMTVDWMDYPSPLQIEPGAPPPSWRFPSGEWFFKHFFLLTLLTPGGSGLKKKGAGNDASMRSAMFVSARVRGIETPRMRWVVNQTAATFFLLVILGAKKKKAWMRSRQWEWCERTWRSERWTTKKSRGSVVSPLQGLAMN